MEGFPPFDDGYGFEPVHHEFFSASSDREAVGGIVDSHFNDQTGVDEIGGCLSKSFNPDFAEESDFSDAVLRYINQVLMEDDSENEACSFHDSTLQVAEKSLFNILNNQNPPSPNNPIHQGSSEATITHANPNHLPEAGVTGDLFSSYSAINPPLNPTPSYRVSDTGESGLDKRNGKGGRKSPKERSDVEEGRRNKHSAAHSVALPDESLLHEMLDKILNFVGVDNESSKENGRAKGSQERPNSGKKRVNRKDAFDMKGLLLQCMDSVASSDHAVAQELLNQIKQLSSPWGNAFQRLGHCFAGALEARFAGTGSVLYKELAAKNKSTSSALKAYKLYLSTIPFMNASNYFETRTIMRVAEKATKLHVIKFGIRQGVHLIPLVQHLSTRPGGPPSLRITGIDFPEPGFRPAAIVEETGRRLANYCNSFNVPFQYHGIAQKWDTINPQDIRIDKDEVVVVLCHYQLHLLQDDTIVENSPRDAVLNMIRRLNPDLFVHGVSNAPYNSPFFVSRFREALFHFSAMFDMFEATMPSDSAGRMVFETEICGRDILNIIACEGAERVDRPEAYKNWHARAVRAGFRQLPLDQEIVKRVKAKVRAHHHKDFLVEEANQWMVQGWKGRVLMAVSCWKPA